MPINQLDIVSDIQYITICSNGLHQRNLITKIKEDLGMRNVLDEYRSFHIYQLNNDSKWSSSGRYHTELGPVKKEKDSDSVFEKLLENTLKH